MDAVLDMYLRLLIALKSEELNGMRVSLGQMRAIRSSNDSVNDRSHLTDRDVISEVGLASRRESEDSKNIKRTNGSALHNAKSWPRRSSSCSYWAHTTS